MEEMIVDKPLHQGPVVRRLLVPIRPHLGIMALAIVSEALRQISGIGAAVFGATLFALAAAGRPAEGLYPYAAAMILLGLARGVFGYLGPYIAHVAAYRMLVALRDDFYRLIEPLAPARLATRRTGDLASAAVSDIEMLESFFAHTAGPAVVAIVVPLMALIALSAINPQLATVTLVFLILLALVPKLALWLGSTLGAELREELALLNSQVLDSLQGMRDTLAFGYVKRRQEVLSKNAESLTNLQARQARNAGLQSAASITIVSAGVISVLLSGSILVSRGEIPAGYLPISVILASSVFTSLMGVVEISKQLSQTFAGARRLFMIFDEEPEVSETPDVYSGTSPEPSINFKDVAFRYAPGEPLVLEGFDLEVPAGSSVALVGMSGAGKTTAISLILRFWDPEAGQILLGGRDLRSYPLHVLRQQFSVVSQDIFLFNDTVRENIRMGRSGATDAEVEDAAAKARIHSFILSLPDGYDTLVGERGVRLSGGEKQRIAIARALLKKSPILILDEATSSLDAESERAIKDTLMAHRGGRTTLMIAHRLSTVMDADEIFVLKDGRVVERGCHRELLARQGEYYRLVAAQSDPRNG
jgi:thiol reductant ABC exporter CydC subunit